MGVSFDDKLNIQLGNQWRVLLLFIPVSGYGMCGNRMLSKRCVCVTGLQYSSLRRFIQGNVAAELFNLAL